MKAAELRTKKPEELKGLVLDLKRERFNLRFQKTNGELENTSRTGKARKDIARIKTILSEQTAAAKKGK